MATYEVYPDGPEWHVALPSDEDVYTYRKKGAALSMAHSLADGDDTVDVYRFDGEFHYREE